MREGAARNVASGRPDFLGSQRESSANHGRSEVLTNTSFFAFWTSAMPGPFTESGSASGIQPPIDGTATSHRRTS
jgi:hypothetical protein